MKGIQANREDKYILKQESYNGKIQEHTRPLKTSPKPEHSSTLPSSQLTILLLHLEKVERASLVVCVTSEG